MFWWDRDRERGGGMSWIWRWGWDLLDKGVRPLPDLLLLFKNIMLLRDIYRVGEHCHVLFLKRAGFMNGKGRAGNWISGNCPHGLGLDIFHLKSLTAEGWNFLFSKEPLPVQGGCETILRLFHITMAWCSKRNATLQSLLQFGYH
jgi:hypothetical protein